MSCTLYDNTIVQAKAALATLQHLIILAEKHPNAANLPFARLYHDMKPLTFQVHNTTKYCDEMLARLTGREPTRFDDNLTTYAEMRARVATVLQAFCAAESDKDEVNRWGEISEATPFGHGGMMEVSGMAYALGLVMPNLFFHISVAYAILRKGGVPLEKADYMTSFVKENFGMGQ